MPHKTTPGQKFHIARHAGCFTLAVLTFREEFAHNYLTAAFRSVSVELGLA